MMAMRDRHPETSFMGLPIMVKNNHPSSGRGDIAKANGAGRIVQKDYVGGGSRGPGAVAGVAFWPRLSRKRRPKGCDLGMMSQEGLVLKHRPRHGHRIDHRCQFVVEP